MVNINAILILEKPNESLGKINNRMNFCPFVN